MELRGLRLQFPGCQWCLPEPSTTHTASPALWYLQITWFLLLGSETSNPPPPTMQPLPPPKRLSFLPCLPTYAVGESSAVAHQVHKAVTPEHPMLTAGHPRFLPSGAGVGVGTPPWPKASAGETSSEHLSSAFRSQRIRGEPPLAESCCFMFLAAGSKQKALLFSYAY